MKHILDTINLLRESQQYEYIIMLCNDFLEFKKEVLVAIRNEQGENNAR